MAERGRTRRQDRGRSAAARLAGPGHPLLTRPLFPSPPRQRQLEAKIHELENKGAEGAEEQ